MAGKQREEQEIKCDRCGEVAFKRPLDWRRKAHCKEIVCSTCCAHQVKKGSST